MFAVPPAVSPAVSPTSASVNVPSPGASFSIDYQTTTSQPRPLEELIREPKWWLRCAKKLQEGQSIPTMPGLTSVDCAVKAIELCTATTETGSRLNEPAKKIAEVAWFNLGNYLAQQHTHTRAQGEPTATIHGKQYGKQDCYRQVLNLNPNDAEAWFSIALYLPPNGSFFLNSQQHSKVACYQKAFDLKKPAYTIEELHALQLLDLALALISGDKAEVSSFETNHLKRLTCLTEALNKNPSLAKAWYKAGNCRQSITIGGNTYNSQACYQQALKLKPKMAKAWCRLAATLSQDDKILVWSKEYSKRECYEQAFLHHIPSAFLDAPMWLDLASTLSTTETVNWGNHALSQKQCYQEVVKIKPDYAEGWCSLGNKLEGEESVLIGNASYNYKQCYQEAVKIKPDYAEGWCCLGDELEGEESVLIGNASYNYKQCYQEALRLDPHLFQAWWGLGCQFSQKDEPIYVNGKPHTQQECFKKVLELSPNLAEVWHNLGYSLKEGEEVEIGGRSYDDKQCFQKAVEIKPDLAIAWCILGVSMKGDEIVTIKDKRYSRVECFQQAVENSPDRAYIWKELAEALKEKEGQTVLVKGISYTSEKCLKRAEVITKLEEAKAAAKPAEAASSS